MKYIRKPWFLALQLFSLLIFWSGCATTGIGANPKPVIFVSTKDALFISLPVVPDSIDLMLANLGWAKGRFAEEIRKELVYQFNHKGIAVPVQANPEDSSGASATLSLVLKSYSTGKGGASLYSGSVLLKTALGERSFTLSKSSNRAQSIERSDPTIDNIRLMAEAVVKEARRKPESRRPRPSESNPPLLMIF